MKLAVLVLDGVLDSSLGISLDLLSAANRIRALAGGRPAFDVVRLTLTRTASRTARGARVPCDAALKTLPTFDAVLVPGWDETDPVRLTHRLKQPAVLRAGKLLREAHARGALVCGACTGVFLLAEAGLLQGRVATTAWFLADALRSRHPDVRLRPELTLARDGRIWTAGAALSVLDLVLALVSRAAGPQVAATCTRYLALETHPTQARYMMVDHFARASDEVARAESYVREHIDRTISLSALARAARTSPRTLARRIAAAAAVTPVGFVQRIRVEHAVHLLETTKLGLDEIARRVGYGDTSTLRRLMKRELGHGPREVRARLGRASAGSP